MDLIRLLTMQDLQGKVFGRIVHTIFDQLLDINEFNINFPKSMK